MSYLPSTTYVAPPRLGRGRPLKTISETEECTFALRSDSEGDESDRTIIARPAGLDAKLATISNSRTKSSPSTQGVSPLPDSSPCSTSSAEDAFQKATGHTSYADSDAGTVFSEDSCPSLTGSNDTTFYTNSSRNSVSSNQSARSSRNRYPSILIPRGSWHEENNIKEVTLALSPAQKIMLSPQALSALPQNLPSLNAPPSFGEGSSMASNSPCMPAVASGPITPDLQNLVPAEGESWGHGGSDDMPINLPIEIAVDEEHSILVSPRNPYSQHDSVGYSTDWSDMVVRFPNIPGATPQENTPIEPDLSDLRGFRTELSDNGVQLSNDAMNLLHNLTRSYSPVSESHGSSATMGKVEMKERSDSGSNSKDLVAATPTLSDYSFSQLSIPSPGGFFSSLQANSRITWSIPSQTKVLSMPSSAIAENFYDVPFKRSSQTIETILELPDKELTDGPPTARQQGFEIPADYQHEVEEDDDLYGAPVNVPKSSPGFEYEATYEEELRHAAEAHIDRTNDWLSAQTSYLSALRETNPLNDPAEYIPQTPHPLRAEEHMELERSCASKAVQFLENATKASETTADIRTFQAAQKASNSVFLEAFEHSISHRGRQDVFLHASARLESINSSRLAMPLRHVQSLLNNITTETLQTHSRPKYRGPYHQNPRATGQFSKTRVQMLFSDAERKQLAMEQILPAIWATEAQRRLFYKGTLFACPAAVDRMAQESKKQTRVLDLAGGATASWAWSAACKWPHIKVITVQSAAQAQPSAQGVYGDKLTNSPQLPERPSNHKIVHVPELWKLPFRDNYFDVVSARTLHIFLRSRPVPNVPSINEWDMTLKECLRVLKPGGILDFIVLDCHISNNSSDNGSKHRRDNSNEASISPTAAVGQCSTSPLATATFHASERLLNPASFNFSRELKSRGFDADGGCSKLVDRLTKNGFADIRRQWVALPVGRTEFSHDNVTASYESFEATPFAYTTTQAGLQRSKIGSILQSNGRSRTPFPPAPRPISEVSSISRIIEQYSNVEAVQGPVGSTADISDVAGLLGSLMWEEWLVRHRLATLHAKKGQDSADATYIAENLLHGINDIFAAGYAKGACFRAVVGWAKKPGKKTATKETSTKEIAKKAIAINTDTDTYRARAAQLARSNPAFEGFPSDETPITANTATSSANKYYGRGFTMQTPMDPMHRDLTVDTTGASVGSNGSPFSYTQSAVERGEVGTIPMMIVE